MPKRNPAPLWYLVFCRVARPIWCVGVAVILLSWLKIVDVNIGWIGFYVAGAATVGSMVLPSLAGIKPVVELTDARIEAQDFEYYDAIRKFRRGAILLYGDISFCLFRKPAEVSCAVAAPESDEPLNEQVAKDCAAYASDIFQQLQDKSPEFAASVEDHAFRVSIMSRGGPDADEICRIQNDLVVWHPNWQHTTGSPNGNPNGDPSGSPNADPNANPAGNASA